MNSQAITNRPKDHFAFGKNWADYSNVINDIRIDEAVKSLQRFFKQEDCVDKTFLDIGCGSGLFSLAALKLGFKKVLAVDLDPDSVRTTTRLLSAHIPEDRWECVEKSVFDLEPNILGYFDVVYSWGVLHHTGNMYKAIQSAAQLVKPNGTMVLALYRKTSLCNFWKWEKRAYNSGPAWFRWLIRVVYKMLYVVALTVRGKNAMQYISHYKRNRGMNWHHDVIDWLGGYPYESITPDELKEFAASLSFQVTKSFVHKAGIGLFGSGCDEFCLQRMIK